LSLNVNTAVVCASGVAVTDKKFGFPRCYRLTKTDEYSSVFGFRRAVKSTHFLLHYRPRVVEAGEPAKDLSARLGVVVPKRLVKAAVRRNLIKRLCREQFRLLLSQLPQRDLVLRLAVKPGVLDRKALAAEIRTLLLKLNTPGR
jgi:ribonuclease P protein component